jgi:hypothetical protein
LPRFAYRPLPEQTIATTTDRNGPATAIERNVASGATIMNGANIATAPHVADRSARATCGADVGEIPVICILCIVARNVGLEEIGPARTDPEVNNIGAIGRNSVAKVARRWLRPSGWPLKWSGCSGSLMKRGGNCAVCKPDWLRIVARSAPMLVGQNNGGPKVVAAERALAIDRARRIVDRAATVRISAAVSIVFDSTASTTCAVSAVDPTDLRAAKDGRLVTATTVPTAARAVHAAT